MLLANDPFPLLVADIGGTNVRFGWIADANAPVGDIQTLQCAHFPRPEDAARDYLNRFQAGVHPARAALAIASAIADGPIKVTNNHWVLDRVTFAASIGAHAVDVFNDFEAIAMVLPHLSAADYRLIGPVTPDRRFAMGVIGPGTGLGVGGVVPVNAIDGGWQTICGEGGHATLAGANAYQNDILRIAYREHTHVSAEKLISGIGLPTLRRAVAEVEGLPVDREMSAEEIGKLGSARSDRLCTQTMHAFCAFLGGVSGNLALTLGARGGIFIGGGIVPKLGDFFFESAFREHFESKGRCADYLRNISTAVITTPYPGLRGLACNDVHVTAGA